jgi:WD40 repeat protein
VFTADSGGGVVAGLDRTHLITGGYGRTLRIWDVARGALPIAVFDAASPTNELAAAAGGARVASVPIGQGVVELWNTASVREPVTVGHVEGSPWGIAFGGGALGVGIGWRVEILDPRFQKIATVDGFLVTAREGEVVVNSDGHYTSYDVRTGKIVTLAGGNHADAAAVSPNGTVDATADDARVELRDVQSGSVAATLDTGSVRVTAVALDDAGHVAVGHDDGGLAIYDAATGGRMATLTGHGGRVDRLFIRGDRLLSGSWDGSLRAWSWPDGAALGVLLTHAGIDVAVSPNGRRLATAERVAAVDVWDARTGRQLDRVPTVEVINAIAFVGEDAVLAAGRAGAIERIELAAPARSDEDIARIAAAGRWQLVDGRAVEAAP